MRSYRSTFILAIALAIGTGSLIASANRQQYKEAQHQRPGETRYQKAIDQLPEPRHEMSFTLEARPDLPAYSLEARPETPLTFVITYNAATGATGFRTLGGVPGNLKRLTSTQPFYSKFSTGIRQKYKYNYSRPPAWA